MNNKKIIDSPGKYQMRNGTLVTIHEKIGNLWEGICWIKQNFLATDDGSVSISNDLSQWKSNTDIIKKTAEEIPLRITNDSSFEKEREKVLDRIENEIKELIENKKYEK